MIGVCGSAVADRADAPVHHVARRDDVGAGLDVARRPCARAARASRRSRPRRRRSTPQWPWLVYSQRQTSVISVSAGHLGAERPQRPLDDPVGGPGARSLLVLLLRDPEEEHRAHAERRELRRLAHDLVDRALRDARRGRAPGARRPRRGRRRAASRRRRGTAAISRTSARSVSVRRRRRRRVTGNALIRARVRQSRDRAVPRRRHRPPDRRRPRGRSWTRSREELPDRPGRGHRRQRHQHAGDAVELAACEQPEDDEQRVQPERVRHHVRHHDVALDLVDEDEEREDPERRHRVDDERVDRAVGSPRARARCRGSPRSPPSRRRRAARSARRRARARSCRGSTCRRPALRPITVERISCPRT